MHTIAKRLHETIEEALEDSFGQELTENRGLLIPEITVATQPQFGHYQCNNALKLAILKMSMS